ncbi:MAG: tRNA pseudouridine(38-40) synthase TruA [Candidatus Sumerlaeaceae bacterium]
MGTGNSRNIRLTVEYDGGRYAGWQRQKNGLAVQQVLEEALERQLGHAVRVNAAGRTDSGVHAIGQVVNFHTTTSLEPRAIERATLLHLPSDVAISDAQEMPMNFDARKSARLRWYRYFLCNRSVRPAVAAQYLSHVIGRLDMRQMQEAADALSGNHDFQAFRAITCTAVRTRLDLLPIEIQQSAEGIITLDFRCRSFLQNMVRILAGTMVSCARGKLTVNEVLAMLASGQRRNEATTLQPNGLFLWRVLYAGEPGTENLPSN